MESDKVNEIISLCKEIIGLDQEIIRLDQKKANIQKSAVEKAIRAGELLTEVRKSLDYGDWLPWIKANLPISQPTVYRWMKLYEERDKLFTVNKLKEAYRLVMPPRETVEDLSRMRDQVEFVRKEKQADRKIKELQGENCHQAGEDIEHGDENLFEPEPFEPLVLDDDYNEKRFQSLVRRGAEDKATWNHFGEIMELSAEVDVEGAETLHSRMKEIKAQIIQACKDFPEGG
jgi:hypothetical protein